MSENKLASSTLGKLKGSLPEEIAGTAQVVGDDCTSICGIAYDSRQVKPGYLFAALRGNNVDGHDFIPSAIKLGAQALLVEKSWIDAQSNIPDIAILAVENTRTALPYIASEYYSNPSRSFVLVGVTGTNGKTSITYMIDAIMRAAGKKSAVIGTVGVQVDAVPVPTHWTVSTTPESSDIQALFAEFRDCGVDCASIEVTSIAIDQERTACCAFDSVVFSNLTQDHLDYHGTFENYTLAKERLFSEYARKYSKPHCSAAINLDDVFGERFVNSTKAVGARAVTYGIERHDADIVAVVGKIGTTSTQFTIIEKSRPGHVLEINLGVGGLFNVSNALAAITVAKLQGVSDHHIRDGLEKMHSVPGRFESVPTGDHGFDVIVDYAHTPDGLENVLRSARRLEPKRLIVVFGCGGNRDTTKRPIMGKIAMELADKVIVTSDNPRREDPNAIISDILQGIDMGQSEGKVTVEPDRRAAIKVALTNQAIEGDLIVIAGKGHETYQLVGDQVLDFDDRKVAAEVLSQ